MRTPSQIARHPIHPMLIPLPIGMFVFALVAQIIFYNRADPTWGAAATYAMAGGVIGGLLAAVPGFIDMLSLPPSRVRGIAITHMALNLTVVALFAVAFSLNMAGSTTAALVTAVIGIGLLLISGWLGGSMVYIHRVAVHDEIQPQERPRTRETVGV